jgi:hypothetical protein
MMATCEKLLESYLAQMAARQGVRKSLGMLALAVVGTLLIGGCGSSGSTTVKSIAITPVSSPVSIGAQLQFAAVVTLTNSSVSTTTTVTWEVDGVAGGNAQCGTITPLGTDQLVGVYTAPTSVPSSSCGGTLEPNLELGQVAITAVAAPTGTSSTSTTGTVTSNVAIVTIGVVLGLSVSPPSASVPAGGTQQFSALFNGVASGATWSLSSTSTGNLGSIDSTGLYTAPPFPPPGNALTVTATATGSNGASVTATATVSISYSDRSLSGPYAFSYTGNDGSGFFAVAGSFVADGNGKIISGLEDIQSFLTGVSTEVAITSSTYVIGSDGRGSASISTNRGTNTWRFVMASNQHAQLTRFDTNITGGGSIDQQSLNVLTNSPSVISGRYAFSALGTDAKPDYNPLGMAGEFPTDGAGNIPNNDAVLDVNDNGISSSGTITRADTTLSGSYSFDSAFPGTGRGTLTLTSTTTGSRTFAFYTVGTPPSDNNVVAQLHLVEIDGVTFTAGDAYLASPITGLANATYVLTTGGNSSAGAYGAAGVFQSNGAGVTSDGVLDINNAGSYNSGPSLGSCTYTVNATTGRIDLGLFVGSGTCSSLSSSGVSEFSGYPTALGSVVLLELDSSALTAGLAYQQCGPVSAGCASASPGLQALSLAVGLNGQGLFHSPPATSASYQSDFVGQVTVASTIASGGNLDINNFTATFAADPIGTAGTSIGTPGTGGRGTITLVPTNPAVTYTLVYYLIQDNAGLLFSSGSSPVGIGMIARQF